MRRMRERQFWIYKNRRDGESYGHEGRWKKFFSDQEVQDWSDGKMRIITWGTKARPQPGDFVFAQQSDQPRSIVGTAEVVDYSHDPLELWIKPGDEFTTSVQIPYKPDLTRISPQVAGIRAMGPVNGALFLLDSKEAATLANFCKRPPLVTTPERRAKDDLLSEAGGGYGTTEENRKVEKAAVKAAIAHFKSDGWPEVVDVQKDCYGYDLIFCRKREVVHVEVKGVRGSVPSFFLTANEENRMRIDDAWRLCVVTSALAKPKVEVFDRRQLAKHFRIKPALFRVSPRSKASL